MMQPWNQQNVTSIASVSAAGRGGWTLTEQDFAPLRYAPLDTIW